MKVRNALRGAGYVTLFGLSAAGWLLDTVRLELEYRLDGPRPAPAPRRRADDDPPFAHGRRRGDALQEPHGVRHDGGAAGRFGG